MSLFFGRSAAPSSQVEQRSFVVPIGSTDTGYAPNLGAAETSLQSVAIRSAADLIASLVSELPVDVYRGEGTERTQVRTPGYLQDPGGEGYGIEDWVYQLVLSWLLRGNSYGDAVTWSPNGLYPTTVSWFYPDDVRGREESGRIAWSVNGRDFPSGRMWHQRVNPVPGRVLGLSPIEFHAAQIGVALSSTRYGQSWFRDSATPGGMLTNTEVDLTAEQVDIAKRRFIASTRGNREPVVLGRGWDYKQIQVSPEESQFLETQGFSEAQCARIFGPGIAEILGYETGDSMTYANVVERRSDVLVFSLNKWVNRVERVLTSMTPSPQYVKLNRDALLQATTLARYQAHAIALAKQFKTVNEVRMNEDLPPVAWGDGPRTTGPTPAPNQDGANGNPA